MAMAAEVRHRAWRGEVNAADGSAGERRMAAECDGEDLRRATADVGASEGVTDRWARGQWTTPTASQISTVDSVHWNSARGVRIAWLRHVSDTWRDWVAT